MLSQNRTQYQKIKSKFAAVVLAILLSQSLIFGIANTASGETSGGSLFLTPATGTYGINSEFSVAVKLNSGSEVINATEGVINYDNKTVEALSVSKGGSILSLWTTEPSINNNAGTISFGGGTPRPGYKGADGQVLAIKFKAKAAGESIMRFASGAVLANDGKGTNILTGMGSASYTISPQEIPPASGATDASNSGTPGNQENAGSGYNLPTVQSSTHPDPNSWYNKSEIALSWTLPEGTEAASFEFDNKANTEADNKPEALVSETSYKNVADGVWYFHIRLKDGQRWGDTAHFRIMVDTLPPSGLDAEVRQVGPGDWPEIIMKSADNGSGMKSYGIIIGSLESQAHEMPADQELFKTSGLTPGEHTAMIIARDNAGNETVKTVDFTIEPIETPTIKNFAAEIKPGDKFFLSGTGLPNTSINLYFSDNNGASSNDTTKADANGNWFYINDKGLAEGQYAVWAEAMNEKGLKSNPTNRISFLVTPPVFARIGSWVINYFTVFTSLLFMVILIIMSIIYIAKLLRKRLKKETVEVEYVLHRNFVDLGEIIDEEFAELNKLAGTTAYNKERVKFKQRIKNYITEAEKKIMKEIKDVEEILK